jgi:hypothetical protein
MKSFKQLFLLFVSVFFLWSNVWGQTYTYTFFSKVYDANNQTKTLGTADWTLVNNGNYYGYDATKGQQIGSGSDPAKSMTLTTSDIGGTITKIEVETSGASSVSATVLASVNGTAYGSAQTISATSTTYTFNGSSSGSIELKWTQTSSKALYIKKITITYVVSPPILANQSFTGMVSTAFSQIPNNTGGSATSWAVTSGTLPAGLSLNTTTGAITGTPTATGSSSVVIEATNANGSSSATYSFSIASGPCLSQISFSSKPTGWVETNITYASGEANFASNTGDLTTLAVSNPNTLSFDLRRTSNTTDKDLIIEVSTTSQSSGFSTITTYNHSNTTSGTTTSISVDLSIYNSFTNVYIRFRKSSSTTSPWYLSNVNVYCYTPPSCTPTITLTTVRPSSAPVDSKVQIEVNNSALISQVKLGTTSLSFTTLNATTIEVDIPTSMSAGTMDLHLIEASSCKVTTPFTVLSSTGTCSSLPATYNDLFISEVYDSDANNQWYMELFNPTANPIVLDNVYQIKRSGDVSPLSYTRTIDLTGTVPPYSVFMLRIGDIPGPFSCNAITYDFTENGAGINKDDQIDLFKNGVQVDIARAPNNDGYTLKRKVIAGQNVPTTTYNAAQWDINSTESCTDLGSFPVTVTNINVVSPADVKGCKVDVSVSSSTPGVTYKWYYNNPKTMTNWLLVNSTNLPSYTLTGNATNHLVISGSTISLNGYQFYCEISDGTCGKLSNTAEFTYENARYYRSVANGNWTTVANWESTNNLGGTWTTACDYPTAANSSKVFIENGTTIQLDIDNDIDYLEIKSGGTLEILPNSQLTIYDSTTNADLLVDGTLLYRSNSSNSLAFGPSATWKLGANATIIKTNNGGAANLRDRYEGGISTIPATAQWIYRYNSDGNPSTVSINMYYPNLRFENTTGTPFVTDSFSAFSGNSSSIVIKGNLEIGITGTSTYRLTNNNYNASPILVMGNTSIGTGSELTNVALTVSQEGTGYELKGNLTVDGILNLVNGSTDRVVKFSGTTNQTVSGSGTINCYKIETNKATGDIILNRNLQAQNELKMVNGHIYTNTNTLELGLNTAQKGTLTYTSGFVIGRMKRWFNGTNSGDVSSLFPMGFNDSGLKNRFARIEYTTAPTAGGDLTVFFVGADMTYNGLVIPAASSGGFGSDVKNAEDQGYWTCTAGALAGGTYTSSFTGEGFTQIVSLADITLLKRPNSASPWTTPGVHIAATGSTVMPTVSRSNLSGFSDFGFGSRNNANPLPVELTNFTVNCEEEVIIHWTTATETNNDYFIVEKTIDGVSWSNVAKIKGSGTSSHPKTYSTTDRIPSNQTTYYRLVQVDLNGDRKTYNATSITCESAEKTVVVYPSPALDFVMVQLSNYHSTNTSLHLFSTDGKLIYSVNIAPKETVYTTEIDVHNLSSGVYFLNVVDLENHSVDVKKIIVE